MPKMRATCNGNLDQKLRASAAKYAEDTAFSCAKTKEYAHRYLFFFSRKVLELRPDGLVFRGKPYNWSSIMAVKRYDSFFWSTFFYAWGAPFANVYLADGIKMVLRGRRLVELGRKPSGRFWRGVTDAYLELAALLENKCSTSR